MSDSTQSEYGDSDRERYEAEMTELRGECDCGRGTVGCERDGQLVCVACAIEIGEENT